MEDNWHLKALCDHIEQSEIKELRINPFFGIPYKHIKGDFKTNLLFDDKTRILRIEIKEK